MTTFYICRHGQTENNQNRRLSGWIDTPLTAEGVRNAASTAAKLHGLRFDKIISSDLGRAFETAKLIARNVDYSGKIEKAHGLREVNYGSLSNQSLGVYPDLTPQDNTHFVPPGGESLAQMQQRVLRCLDEIVLANESKVILLVAHDGTINAIHASFSGQDIGLTDASSDNPHDFVAEFVYDNGRITSFSELHG